MIGAAASLLGILAAGTAQGENSVSGDQGLYITVEPYISIQSNHGPYFDLGRIQTGLFGGTLIWRVDANSEVVRFFVAASPLWLDDDPLDTSVSPIMLYLDLGADLEIEFGAPAPGEDDHVEFTGDTMVGKYPARTTEAVTYESTQNRLFSQYVTTRIHWFQDDPEKPNGRYYGIVQLWGHVLDRDPDPARGQTDIRAPRAAKERPFPLGGGLLPDIDHRSSVQKQPGGSLGREQESDHASLPGIQIRFPPDREGLRVPNARRKSGSFAEAGAPLPLHDRRARELGAGVVRHLPGGRFAFEDHQSHEGHEDDPEHDEQETPLGAQKTHAGHRARRLKSRATARV
jgi:hypothetical protein